MPISLIETGLRIAAAGVEYLTGGSESQLPVNIPIEPVSPPGVVIFSDQPLPNMDNISLNAPPAKKVGCGPEGKDPCRDLHCYWGFTPIGIIMAGAAISRKRTS